MITNLQKSFWKRPESPAENTFLKTVFLSENTFFKSRPRMAPQADPQSGKCSYIDPLSFIRSSKTGLLRSKHNLLPRVFDLNPSLS